ncbi:MAG: hypothetical protein AAGA86_06130 [Bacteroidota bacterium]
MKKVLKIVAIVFGILVLGLLLFLGIVHEPLPLGKSGPEAEALAQKMLKALNHEAFEQTRFLEWSFRNGAHRYQWDKYQGRVSVRWDKINVELDLNTPSRSDVRENGKPIRGLTKNAYVAKAQKLFNNDSFWLVAPFKVFDPGTSRSLVRFPDGEEALMVTYTSGGTTPGDSYLWLLNKNGFPNAYKMWVSILPIGGLEASWDDWIVTESGAFLPKSHELGPFTLSMGDVRGYQ